MVFRVLFKCWLLLEVTVQPNFLLLLEAAVQPNFAVAGRAVAGSHCETRLCCCWKGCCWKPLCDQTLLLLEVDVRPNFLLLLEGAVRPNFLLLLEGAVQPDFAVAGSPCATRLRCCWKPLCDQTLMLLEVAVRPNFLLLLEGTVRPDSGCCWKPLCDQTLAVGAAGFGICRWLPDLAFARGNRTWHFPGATGLSIFRGYQT